MLMYMFIHVDPLIKLSGNNKQLAYSEWSDLQKYLSNSGKVMNNLKLIRKQIEELKIQNAFMNKIKHLYDRVKSMDIEEGIKSIWMYTRSMTEYYEFVTDKVQIEKRQYMSPKSPRSPRL